MHLTNLCKSISIDIKRLKTLLEATVVLQSSMDHLWWDRIACKQDLFNPNADVIFSHLPALYGDLRY